MSSDTGFAAFFAELDDNERHTVMSLVEGLLNDEPLAVAFINLLREIPWPNGQFAVDTGRGYKLTGRAVVDTENGPAKLDIVLSRADGQPFGNGSAEFSLTVSIDEDLDGVERKLTPIVAVAPCAGVTGETATE